MSYVDQVFVRNINHVCCPLVPTHTSCKVILFLSLLLSFLSFIRFLYPRFVRLIILLILGYIYFGTSLYVQNILSQSVSIKVLKHLNYTHRISYFCCCYSSYCSSSKISTFWLRKHSYFVRLLYEKLNVK